MKNFKWTSLFAVVVLLLVAFTIYDFQRGKKAVLKKESESKVLTFEKTKITGLEISNLGASLSGSTTENTPPRKFELKDGIWKVTAPFQDSADQQAMDTYLDALLSEKVLELVTEDAKSITQFGLDKPLFTLKVLSQDKAEFLKLGSVKAYDGSLYGQVNDSKKIVLLSSAWNVHLTKPASELRDKKMFRGDFKAKPVSLELKGRVDSTEVDLSF